MKVQDNRSICPLCGIMSTITRRWFLLVLDQIGKYDKIHYNELLKVLQPISPKSLADVLRELRESGLVNKSVSKKTSLVIEYSLNRNGRELKKAITPLLKWASAYTEHTNCPILYKSIAVHYSEGQK